MVGERETPVSGDLYYHFKGKIYQVWCVATHSETGEKLAIYRALDACSDSDPCARPLEMFLSPVDKAKYPGVKQKWRFEKIIQPPEDGSF